MSVTHCALTRHFAVTEEYIALDDKIAGFYWRCIVVCLMNAAVRRQNLDMIATAIRVVRNACCYYVFSKAASVCKKGPIAVLLYRQQCALRPQSRTPVSIGRKIAHEPDQQEQRT